MISTKGHGANGLSVVLAGYFRKRSRAISVLAAFAVTAGSLVVLAAPARAQNGPPTVGCTTGSSCMIELNYQVTYTGSSGGHNGVVVPPPPCVGVPFGDAHTGSEAIINLLSNNNAPVSQPSSPPAATASPAPTFTSSSPSPAVSTAGTATSTPTTAVATPAATTPVAATQTGATQAAATPVAATSAVAPPAVAASTTAPPPPANLSTQEQQILGQAQQLVGTNPITPGEWYQVTGNPYATSTAQQKCNNLAPFIWVPGGSNVLQADGVNIPPETLAGLAYSQLTTARLAAVTLDPQGTNDTNLPTFVDVALRPPARGVLSVTAKGDPYVWATATTPDGESATVWAWVTGLTITPGTPNATTFNQQRCSVAHLSADGHTFLLGSRYSKAAMSRVGAGQQIDCGVTYTAPGTFDLTANVTWNACWAPGLATTDGPPGGCQRVPGAADLAASISPLDRVTVREIQSVNNG